MVYVSSSGAVTQSRSPFRLTLFSDLFWGIVNFFGLFFNTMVGSVDPNTRKPFEKRAPAFGRKEASGGGGGGGKAPSNVRGMDALKKQQGACAGAGG